VGNCILSPIYERQFRELAPLRRHICSLLPLGRIRTIFEPGCGSGLLAGELRPLTDAVYTGMDIDPDILPPEPGFIRGDALADPPPADLYVTTFFFSSVQKPVPWLKRVRRRLAPGGVFAVFGEYDYESIGEFPDRGLAAAVRAALLRDGLVTSHGGRLDELFDLAGFSKSAGGEIRSDPSEPDRDFLDMHLRELPKELPLMTWRIVWGIWRGRY
jgi:SAM-dependent methyltransferase